MKDVELFWNYNHTEYAVLISSGFGAGFSTWNHEPSLAYDKRVVEFWLDHAENKEWMSSVTEEDWGVYPQSEANKEARNFFKSIGYSEHLCILGFPSIRLEWIPKGRKWKLVEFDGAESLEFEDKQEWISF